MRVYKLKLRHGNAEFEAEGDQKFIEDHLRGFKPLLNLPEPIPMKGSLQTRRTSVKSRLTRNRSKITAPEYPAAAVTPLKAFMKQAKPKGQPSTAVALGFHHTKHFNSATFTNRDVASAGKAIGVKFTNLPLSLMAAAKQGKIRKVSKGTWKVAAHPPTPSKKPRRSKHAALKR